MNNVVQLPTKATDDKPTIPDFITGADIIKMNDQELDNLVDAIRNRREANHSHYKTVITGTKNMSEDKINNAIAKKSEMIIKKIQVIDAAFEKMQTYVNEIRGLRIQAGLELI